MRSADKGKLRIVYVGDLAPWATCRERMDVLAEMGHEIIPVDMRPFHTAGHRIQRMITHRLLVGASVRALNERLRAVARESDYDWVWVDKGTWVYPETLTAFKEAKGATLIHYTPDPAILYHRTRYFMRCIPIYDHVITNKRYELDLYRAHGARSVLWSCTAYSGNLFAKVEPTAEDRARYDCNVVFVGHCEPHYVRTVRVAAEAVDGVCVWGRWSRAARFRPWLRRVWRGDRAWGTEYVKALKCAKIGLGLLTRLAPDKATTRSMEIPAAGTFMLAERTDEHLELYEEDHEAVFFDSPDELCDKLRYYLAHDDERERIAAAGHRRAVQCGYSYRHRIHEAVGRIQALSSGAAATAGAPVRN